jgi:hypothetical protein
LHDFSPPYRTQRKIVHRPWFSPEEYKRLYKATRQYAHYSKDNHYEWNAEQVHDYVLFHGEHWPPSRRGEEPSASRRDDREEKPQRKGLPGLGYTLQAKGHENDRRLLRR